MRNFLSFSFLLLLTIGLISCSGEQETHQKEFAIAIHGGAGVISQDIDPEIRDGYLASLEEALTIGRDILANGGTAMDAIVETIIYLEDDPRYNAGRGAVYTNEAIHELDASIMDGRDLNAGAITGVRTVKNPIVLARKVMEESRHVFFAADGAERFADLMDVERVDNSFFNTENRRRALERALEREAVEMDHSSVIQENDKSWKYGTVGAVALDRDGNLAAGTSTGGMTNKRHGRVGDSPIIAAGTYADNNTCAVSSTGHGEKFIRNAVAYQICAQMEFAGKTLAEAARNVIWEKLDEGDGGIIAVDYAGNIVMEFSSPGMFRGAADSDGFFEVAIWE